MRVFAISDLHMTTTENKPMEVFGDSWECYLEKIFSDWKSRVNNDDIVLVCGDISWAMKLENAAKDLKILSELPGKKVFIRGNHDYWWGSVSKVRENLQGDMFALQNDAQSFEGVVVCGCRGWGVPDSNNPTVEDVKLYNREIIRMDMALSAASAKRVDGDMLIAMIHFPPFDVLRRDSGFTDLFHKYSVDKVVYGHLHGSSCRSDLYVKKDGIEYYLTSCDLLGNKLALILDKS